MASLLLAAAFGAVARAAVIESSIARPTDASIPHHTYLQPEITQPPSPKMVHELLRRQDSDVQTYFTGPDNTCAYISGRIGVAYTCGYTDGYCAIIATGGVGALGCCSDSSCEFSFGCKDQSEVSAGDCDNGCLNDIYTLKCTNSAAPYCGTVRISSSISDFFCQSTSYTTPMEASTTYSGETDGRSYAQVVFTLDPTSTAGSSSRGSSAEGGLNSVTASSSGSSSSSSTSSIASTKSSSSTPIGPIVGGVVGGVAVLALIAFGIWFLMRRNKKNKAATAPAPAAAYPQMQQSPPPGAPSPGPMGGAAGDHQSVYNPQYPQQYPSPQGYQSAQGGAYYPNQEKPLDSYATGQAPAQPTSPMSQADDPRYSMQPSSPSSTVHSFQPQHTGGTYQTQAPNVPSTVYEAGGDAVGAQGPNANHRGQFHEIG